MVLLFMVVLAFMVVPSSSSQTTCFQQYVWQLQNLPVTYVMTHDSVAVGEDGPTHEPIEQLASVFDT